MTAHRDRPQVSRLEIVDTGRRRRFSDAEKVRIVEGSLAGHRMVSATARRHGIARSLLTIWRRAYREGRLWADAPSGFARVIVAPEMPEAAPAVREPRRASPIEVVLANGRRVVVGADVDVTALARIVSALEGA